MIRINLVGRLGNEIYQYVACRTIAEMLGTNFYAGKGLNYHFGDNNDKMIFKHFNCEQGIIDGDILYNFYENSDVYGPCRHADEIKDYTLLNGFFHNPIWFNMNYENIKKWFMFKKEYNDVIDKYNVDDWCYIHFRGTDNYNNIIEYYKKSVKQINMKKYIIMTEDYDKAVKEFKWMYDEGIEYNIISSDDYIEDFYTLTRAKYYIVSYSTFSECAAYLNIHKHNIIFPLKK